MRMVLWLALSLAQPASAFEVRCADHPVMRTVLAAAPAMQLNVSYAGKVVTPDQSRRPVGPAEHYPWGLDLTVDEPAGAIRYDLHQAIAGDFQFHDRGGFAGGKGYVLDYSGRSEPIAVMPLVPAGFLPGLMLRAIAAQGTCAPAAENDGRTLHVTRFAGSSRDLIFDAHRRLIEVRRALQPSVFGEQRRDTTFSDYREVGGVWIPGRIEQRSSNPIQGGWTSTLRLVFAKPAKLTADAGTPPAGTIAAAARTTKFAVEARGEGVRLLRNVAVAGRFSYNMLLVGQSDRVLLFDAVLDDATSERVVTEAGRLFPGKPLTLILSHAHGDHIGGLRHYLASGARIIAPKGMASLIERIRTVAKIAPRVGQVQEVSDRFELADAVNPVQLRDFPSAHSDHLLVAYLPRQSILLQADLINAGDYPDHAHSADLLRWIGSNRLVVREIVGIHGQSVPGPSAGQE